MAQTKPKAGQFYGVSNNGTDGQFLKTDGTGGMSWDSPITNPTITSIDYPGSTTAADPAGGQSVIINGTLFASGVTCTVGGTSAVTAFNSATQITITTPAKAAGPYTVAVTNTNGGTAYQANFIQYSGVPVWSTAAGTLGNVLEGGAASFQVTATEGSDTIEYAVTTGTLPTGLSLATATGAITGTAGSVSADTTTTFSITATDDENQTSSERSFSITVQNDAPSNHFNTVLYTGNGGTQSVTGVGFAPDFTWIKSRTLAVDHAAFDTVRGATKYLSPSTTGAEGTYSTVLNAFGSDGFTVGSNAGVNSSSQNYVAWNFKAGGAAVANTNGTINSQVSVNNSLGFSIVKYTTPTTNNFSIGHGLNSTPELVFYKGLDVVSSWTTYAEPIGATKYLSLNLTNAATTSAFPFNDTAPTNTVLNLGSSTVWYGTSKQYIAYCFTSKPGFSKVGSYTGNGSASGPIIQTGFEPAWLMTKRTDVAGYDWYVWDNKRSPSNPRNEVLRPNSSSAEVDYSAYPHDFYSNGFAINTSDGAFNASGGTYIYLAFAADGSTATPSLASSFATELYTGNGGTKTVTTGFKPDFTWIKDRDTAYQHNLYDSIRGATNTIESNGNIAEYSLSGLTSFNTNGFTLGSNAGNNQNSSPNVSWNWKAGGTPYINTDGTTTSIVSANQAAGFSIVQYTAAGTTIAGHGLSQAPELIIQRLYDIGQNWFVYSAPTGLEGYLNLNTNNALATDSTWISDVTNSTFTEAWTGNSYSYINYCWHSVAGYSKVGTYTGLGSGGPLTVNVGFAPTLVIIKRTDSTGAWRMFDTARGTDKSLRANSPDAEYDDISNYVDFTSTGFYFNTSQANPDINASGGTYIYLAIKEN
jgi:hypothetical protein